MRLFVRSGSHKLYLTIVAPTRSELAQRLGSEWFTMGEHSHTFHVSNVEAEASASNVPAGAVVGGLIGLLAGPLGLLTGSIVGGAIGNNSDRNEIAQIQRFNNS